MSKNFIFDSLVSDEFVISTAVEKLICQYAYNKKVTLQEISIALKMPKAYVEDTVKELTSKKAIICEDLIYTTNFIILKHDEIKYLREMLTFNINEFADYFQKILSEYDNHIKFYGTDFRMSRLGYIICPNVIREVTSNIPNVKTDYESATIDNWGRYICRESDDDNPMFISGCNALNTNNGEKLQYFWLEKYFEYDTVYIGGMKKILDLNLINKAHNGIIERRFISDDEAVNLIIANMIRPTYAKDGYILNFPCFSKKSFYDFISVFYIKNSLFRKKIREQYCLFQTNVVTYMEKIIPKHLKSHIEGVSNYYVNRILSMFIFDVCNELINRGVLKEPIMIDKAMSDGMCYISNKE